MLHNYKLRTGDGYKIRKRTEDNNSEEPSAICKEMKKPHKNKSD
jgi:hypothetical protein